MERFATFLLVAILTATAAPSSRAQTTVTHFYHSIGNNWTGNGLASSFRALGTASRKFTMLATFTGNNFYKVNNQSDNSDNNFNSPTGSTVWSNTIALNTIGTAFLYGDGNGGAGSFPTTNGKFYTYIWQDVSTSENAGAVVMETSGLPASLSTVTVSPAVPNPAEAVTVTVTLSATPSAEENVFVRYSTDNFATYGTLLSPTSGGGTATQTFTIPAQSGGTTVTYYALTSTLASGSLSGSAYNTDLATINFNNNSGVNFAYTVLPMELVRFEAREEGARVALFWQTASETNNRAFHIERSADSENWDEIGQVAGQQHSIDLKNYSWEDHDPLVGNSYYRLRQVDFDGREGFSPVEKVERGAAVRFTVFPNPTVNSTTIKTFSEKEGEALVDLADGAGRWIGTVHFRLERGENLLVMPLSGMAGGWYTLVYSGPNGKFSQRILIND